VLVALLLVVALACLCVGLMLSTPNVLDPDVWVIDGRPRYHRRECEIIDGQDAEPVPLRQASEDGFIPCALCQPNS